METINPDTQPDELVCQTLRNGQRIPKLGYWTAVSRNPGRDLSQALETGYRHILLGPRGQRDDVTMAQTLTSWMDQGRLSREDLFISTMIDLNQQRPLSNVCQDVTTRLQSLGISHVDAVILHKSDPKSIGDNLRQRKALLTLWRDLERLISDNQTRCLSLSNFRQEEVELIFASCDITPSILWFSDPPEKLGWKGVSHAQVYSQYREMKFGVLPRLDRPETEWVRSLSPALSSTAMRLSRSPVQVFQRFHIQKKILVCMAADGKLVDASFKAFDFFLSKEDMTQLEKLPL